MKLRYCPNCKRKVGKKFTLGQLVLMVTLWSVIIPGIFYTIFHAKKCPICGTPTSLAFEKKAPAPAAKPAKKGKKK